MRNVVFGAGKISEVGLSFGCERWKRLAQHRIKEGIGTKPVKAMGLRNGVVGTDQTRIRD